MGHGGPDWGTAGPLATVYTLEDMAELAARLGSIVTFDRRGNIILLEDFNGSLAKSASWSYSAGGSVGIDNLYALHGDFACKFVSPTSGYSMLTYQLAFPIISKMGIELAWNRLDGGNLSEVFVRFDLDDGTDWLYALVWWDAASGIWYLYDKDAGNVALSPVVNYSDAVYAFNHFKLVVDHINRKYVRLLVNNLSYDLSAYNLDIGVPSVPAHIEMSVQFKANSGGIATNYLDNLIVTQNEP